MGVIPKAWMPSCSMDRIICHWTAGGHKASSLDRQHYHILIESDGDLVRGFHSIKDNVDTSDGVYAAHTRGCNTRSIGISVCCMAGAKEHPFQAGNFPMTQIQWKMMAKVAAELAAEYAIPITDRTVLGHGEVQEKLNKKQNGKWDPMVLPWKPGLRKSEVGDAFRSAVRDASQAGALASAVLSSDGEGLLMTNAVLNGVELKRAVFYDEDVFLAVSDLQSVPGVKVLQGGNGHVVPIEIAARQFDFTSAIIESVDPAVKGERWVSGKDIANHVDSKLNYDPDRRIVSLTWV